MHLIKISLLALSLAFTSGATLADTAEKDNSARLQAAIDDRPAKDKARDAARHPAETLAFFGLEPDMVVAEALPGNGWYTNILANYLNKRATLYGINYVDSMWPMFSFATDEWVKKRIQGTAKFPSLVAGFTNSGIKAKAFTFNTVPQEAVGSVDMVLMIRALHNLNRFESKSGTRTQALAAIRGMLKPGGLVGVVQHRLPESAPEAGADGSRGYLKQSDVIATFEKAGFELVAQSEINANPKDQPGPEDIVWRLPPSLNTSKEDPELRKKMVAIGESDRMTLLFRKSE